MDRQVGDAERLLIGGANSEIDKAIECFHDDANRVRNDPRLVYRDVATRSDPRRNQYTLTVETNEAAIRSFLTYRDNAIKRLRAMKLDPTADLAEIKKLKAEIPNATVIVEREQTQSLFSEPLPAEVARQIASKRTGRGWLMRWRVLYGERLRVIWRGSKFSRRPEKQRQEAADCRAQAQHETLEPGGEHVTPWQVPGQR